MISRELAQVQRSQRIDRDKFVAASTVTYTHVKKEFETLCRNFGFTNAMAASYFSSHQQAIRIRHKIEIATVLEGYVSRAVTTGGDDFADNGNTIEYAYQFLGKYIHFLENLISGTFQSKKIGHSGGDRLIFLDPDTPLVSAFIDTMMVSIVDRLVAGLPAVSPVMPDEDEDVDAFQDWLEATKFVGDVGINLHIDAIPKIPIDILFKLGGQEIADVKLMPPSIKTSMQSMLKAWDDRPIKFLKHKPTSPMASKTNPGHVSPYSRPPTRVDSGLASLDLTVDIVKQPETSHSVRNFYSSSKLDFQRSRDCAQTISDFLDILLIYLQTANLGNFKGSIAVLMQPSILLLLTFHLNKIRQKPTDMSQLYDDLVSCLLRQMNPDPKDPFCLSEMILNRHERILPRHAQYLRKNLVVEVVDAIVCRTIHNGPTTSFSFFDASLATAQSRTCETKLVEVSDLFRQYIGKFGEDFRTLPEDSGIEPTLWAPLSKLLFESTQSVPTVSDQDRCAQEIDTSLKIQSGSASFLSADDCFLAEGSYPFKFLDHLDLIKDYEDVEKRLPACFHLEDEKPELTVPTPLAWEILVRYTAEHADTTKDFLATWMLAGIRKKIDVGLIKKLIPGHSFVFIPKWYTAARKIMFHLFLDSGSMEVNLFKKITGLEDLHKIIDRNFRIWQTLPDWFKIRLKSLAPLFETLKPILTFSNHVRKVADYWKTTYDHHKEILVNYKQTWKAQIQIVKKSAQTKKFTTFSSQEEVRILKNSKKLTGSNELKTAMLYLRAISIQADKLWEVVTQKFEADEWDGCLLMQAYTLSMIAFLYNTTVTTGLRSQNLSDTKSINSSTLWTPATVLRHMDPDSFDIDLEGILSKNHRVPTLRNIALPLGSSFEIDRTGFSSVQMYAIRLYLIQKLLFCAGQQADQSSFSLNDNVLFNWDPKKMKRRDWKKVLPRKITESTWTAFGKFIFKKYIPQSLGLKPITINTLRKLLVTVQMGAGVSSARRLTGHKSDNSLLHYVLAVPWLDNLLESFQPADKPFLAKAILNFEVTRILQSGESLPHTEILEHFSCENCRNMIEQNKVSKSEGILELRKTLEFVFWTKLHQANLDKFKLGRENFKQIFKEAIVLVRADPARDCISHVAQPPPSTGQLPFVRGPGRVRNEPQGVGHGGQQVPPLQERQEKGNGGLPILILFS